MRKKVPTKKAFSFYRSYYESMNALNDKQYAAFSRTLNSVMFFDKHIEGVSFKDQMLQILWLSIKHNVRASIDGFLSKYKITYIQALNTHPCQPPTKGACKPPYEPPCQQGEGEVKVEGKEKEQQPALSRFDEFWKAYPKKKSKGAAEKAFNRLRLGNGLFDKIMNGVQLAKYSPEWQKDNGQFIPYPATWLNAKGWEDEISLVGSKQKEYVG